MSDASLLSKYRLNRLEGHLSSRWQKVAAGVTGLTVVGGLGFGLLHTQLFSVNQIEITGTSHLSTDQIHQTARLRKGMFLIDVDEKQIKARLTANPWIEDVDVKRSWPDLVKVKVTERQALAIAQSSDQKWATLSKGGMVLGFSDEPPSGLPNAIGIETPKEAGAYVSSEVARNLVLVAERLPQSLRPKVVQMDQDSSGIRLGLDSGLIVLVGNRDQLDAKLTSAATVISKSDLKNYVTLDVRSPTSPLAIPAQVSTSTTFLKNSLDSTKPSTTSTKPST